MEELLVTTPTTEEVATQEVEEISPTPHEEVVGEETAQETTPEETSPAVDYAAMAAEDLSQLQEMFPSMRPYTHLSQIPNAMRYATLRDAGLTVEEAFWAACHHVMDKTPTYDNRSHLRSSVPRGAAGNPAMMTASEMAMAKELFGDLTESEIQTLYHKCRS